MYAIRSYYEETGTVVEWQKHNGDEVKEGEIILVIETDKVAIDVEAPGSGILDGISAEVGDVVPIGTVIAYILEPGESLPESAKKTTPAEKPAGQPGATAGPTTPRITSYNVCYTKLLRKRWTLFYSIYCRMLSSLHQVANGSLFALKKIGKIIGCRFSWRTKARE